METLKETKKHNSDEGGASPKRRKSRCAEPLVNLLRGKAAADREIRHDQTTGVTCKTTGTGQSTANDESYDPSAATNEYGIFDCCGKATK